MFIYNPPEIFHVYCCVLWSRNLIGFFSSSKKSWQCSLMTPTPFHSTLNTHAHAHHTYPHTHTQRGHNTSFHPMHILSICPELSFSQSSQGVIQEDPLKGRFSSRRWAFGRCHEMGCWWPCLHLALVQQCQPGEQTPAASGVLTPPYGLRRVHPPLSGPSLLN